MVTTTVWQYDPTAVANLEPGATATSPHPADTKQIHDSVNVLETAVTALQNTQNSGGLPIKFVPPGTDLIQPALANYEGMVVLQRGVHLVSTPVVQNKRQMVVGEGGGATFVRPTKAMSALWVIGNGTPSDRTYTGSMCLDCNGLAAVGLDCNIVGTTGNLNGEPDGQPIMERLYVDDATDTGIWLRGTDTQAWHLNQCRVRRATNYAYHLQGPDGWMTDCEGTASGATGIGCMVECANAHFKGNKMWYTRSHGWDIKGTRNAFIDCESQDTGGHGWFIEWDKNSFVGCWADSAGMYDVGGVANTWDGFYLASGLRLTAMTGCFAFDRQPSGHAVQQRYAFNMSASTYNVGRTTNGTAAPTGTGTMPILIGSLMGGGPSDANFANLGGVLNLR